jgi:hypothetical protein
MDKKFKDIILLYDEKDIPNLHNIGFEILRFECTCPADCERHTQVFHTGISEKFESKLVSEVNDYYLSENSFNPDFLYCYVLEHYSTLSRGLVYDIDDEEEYEKFSLIKNLSKDIMNKLNTIDNFVLFIVNPYECSIDKNDFVVLHKHLKEKNINPEKVICGMYSNRHVNVWYKSICKKRKIKKKIKFAFCDFPLMRKAKELMEYNFYGNSGDDFLTVKRENKILCYNRRITKPHRMLFLLSVDRDKLFDGNLISFNFKFNEERHQLHSKDSEFEPYDEWDQDLFIDKSNYIKIFKKLLKREKNVIDHENFDEINGFGFEYPEVYKNSYVSFVSESAFFDPYAYVTEKSFKPFCHFHPFVIMGSYGTVKKLKELGFKTFSDFWDESYDLEKNHNIRFEKVYNIFLQLNSMSLDELHNMYVKMIPILKHNYNLMNDYGEKEDEFWNNYKTKIIEQFNDKS